MAKPMVTPWAEVAPYVGPQGATCDVCGETIMRGAMHVRWRPAQRCYEVGGALFGQHERLGLGLAHRKCVSLPKGRAD